MARTGSTLLLLLFLSLRPLPAAADARDHDVRLPPGKTSVTLKGSLVGRTSVSYRIGAEAGQILSVTMRASNRAAYFNVYEPGRGPGDQALASSEMTGGLVPEINRFSGKLASSGVFTIDVFLYRAAARRNERAGFSLTIGVSPAVDSAAPVKGDYADGLQGGPDHWRVSGLRGGALRVRDAPGSMARVRARLGNGAVLRNAGCRMSEGARWCKVVVADGAVAGWVDGRYLVEAAVPADALVPGTSFHATGEIPCAQFAGQPMRACRFGVVREGPGRATVTIFIPGATRRIRFEAGAPSTSDASDALQFSRSQDLFVISIGAERYEIPYAVPSGG